MIIRKKNIIPNIVAFLMCLISTTSTLINYIIPIGILRTLLVAICFATEICFMVRLKWDKKKISTVIFLILLSIFPFINSGSWGFYSKLYYIGSLLMIPMIMSGVWAIKHSFRFMYIMYTFYAVCTIIFYFTPSFYKGTIVNLFPDEKSRLLSMYNNSCMPGLTNHYSTNGMFLATGLLMAFAYLMITNIKKKGYFQVLFFLAALLLTGKRAQLIFSACAIYIVYCIIIMTRGKKALNKLLKIVGLFLAVVLIATIVFSAIPALATVVVRLQESLAEGDLDNGRYIIWEVAIHVFKENPVWGIGWKEFSTSYGYALLRSETAYDAHNVFLQLLCETGVIGFCLYAFWFINLLLKGIRQVKLVFADSHATRDEQYAICFALCFQIFFLLYCMTGNPLYEKMTFFPYFLCCGITLYFENRKESSF